VVVEGRISIFELLSLLGLAIAVISLLISARTGQEQTQTRRAEFSFRVWQAFMDEEVQKAFLEIEWGQFEYPSGGDNGFASPEQERRIDRLLYLLDEVALLVQNRVLTEADKKRWSYQASRVLKNESVQRYFEFLDDFFAQNDSPLRAHDASRRVFLQT
jgi:hypothetical protein